MAAVSCSMLKRSGVLAALAFSTSLSAQTPGHSEPGAIFALTNSSSGNAVVAYRRSADGSLSPAGSFATGGAGTGAGLGSQDAVVVSNDRRALLAVNAGSDSISSFRVEDHGGLALAHTVYSGGPMPTSIALRGSLVYVLNAGAPNNVTGFRLSDSGTLTPIDNSTRPLSAVSTAPGQVGFSRDGDTLIVTERGTNRVTTFAVGDDGTLQGPFVFPSAGPVPFGFASAQRNTLLVSEAGAGGGASTYRADDGALRPVSAMVMTGQRAACWAAVTPNGRFGYVTNAGTGNISGIAIATDGSARLLNADGVTAVTGGNPTDMAMSRDGHYLYARVAALGQIAAFRVRADGSLAPLPALTGTPAGLAGLAGY